MAPAAAAPDGDGVVINEIYARGGSANQPFTNKFVELHNPTDAPIDLDGMSLQYRSATGAADTSGKKDLTGEIPADGYWLVQGSSNADNGDALPTPDQDWGVGLQGSNGTVALVDSTDTQALPTGDVTESDADYLVDLVGYGSSNTWEGSGTAETSGGNSDPQSITRTDGLDTDDNTDDFKIIDFPTPTNSVGDTVEPPEGPDCSEVPDESTIAEIQGEGDETPFDGCEVTTEGVVTAVYTVGGFNGAYIQTEGTGGEIDLAAHTASDGIFVYGSDFANAVEIGDFVGVTGTATEYFELTQIATTGGPQDVGDTFDPVEPALIEWPATDEERERFEGMLIAPQGDYTVTNTYQANRYGEIGLALGDEPLRQPTDFAEPQSAEAAAIEAENAANKVNLDDGATWDYTNFDRDYHETPLPYLSLENPVRVGAAVTFDDPVILDYRNDNWKFQPVKQVVGESADASDDRVDSPVSFENTRSAAPSVDGDLSIGAFNVLNYFTDLGENEANCEFHPDREGNPGDSNYCDVRGAYNQAGLERQTAKIVSAITELDADVLTLQEVENSRHFPNGTNAAEGMNERDASLATLVDELNEVAGEGVWDYVPSAADYPADEDVIRNAFIYQTDAAAPVGESDILVGSDAFYNAREPLSQEFALLDGNGDVNEDAETVLLVTTHMKSKGSGSGDNADQGDGQAASNPDRVAQAIAMAEYIEERVGEVGTDNAFILGDLNSYTMEDPMQVLYEAGYTDIGDELTDQSTYSYDGLIGSLDHVMGNEAGMKLVTDASVWNVNAYESIALEYSRYNYNVVDFYEATPHRSSDHDPMIVGLDLTADVGPSDTVDLNLLGINDFHGRLFDYKTDDDGVQTNDTLSFAGTVEELRAQGGEDNTLFLAAGDNFGASLFTSSIQDEKPTIDFLNALELGVTAVGNHEFDRGFETLTTDVYDQADWPILGANVYESDTETPAMDEYEIFEIDGLDVAVIGVVTKDVPSLVRPGGVSMLDFGDPVEAINRVADQLTDGDDSNGEADVILASLHEGGPLGDDATLEEQLAASPLFTGIVEDISSEVAAIFTGHTHQAYILDGPVPGGDGETRPVTQSGSYGEFVTQVNLTVDRESGDVEEYEARNVGLTDTPYADLIDRFPRVADAKGVLDQALEFAEEEGSKVIGEVTADITTAHKTDADGTVRRDDRSKESTLGNLVGNALVAELGSEENGAATIGVVNSGGLRAELLYEASGEEEDGEVTYAEANAVLPFLNDLWTLTLTGEQFLDMLEQQWQPEDARSSFLKLGLSENVSYTYDPDAERGEHITSVMIDGAPLDLETEYRIGTFSFLAEGGDHFDAFTGATDVRETGLIDRDAWISFITENSPLSPDFAKHATIVDPLPGELEAGEDVSFEVSGLDLTSLGSPANTSLSVYLIPEGSDDRGEAVHTADVEDGAATVAFTVPADLEGSYMLEMLVEPSETLIQVPVTVTSDGTEPTPTPTPTETESPTTPGGDGGTGGTGGTGGDGGTGGTVGDGGTGSGSGGLPSTGADLALLGPALLLLFGGATVAAAVRRRRLAVNE